MSRAHDEQTLGLAGLFQAAALVEQIATRGMVSQNTFETSIFSIMQLDPETSEDIYGGSDELPYNLHLGLQNLKDMVEKPRAEHNKDVVRYALSMMHLERKLSANPEMLQTIAQRLKQVSEQARYFNPDDPDAMSNPATFCHPNVIANIASLYQDTISSFSFRIQVTGDPRHLQNSENAAKVRALLLAGIRSAMLWRQKGGKRWQLLFFKSRIRPSLKKIMG
ncbi:high frequency lysogenization protein HflD [uncultured Neptuniibacter sp.]|uniref:high frequency lysogenization protein HflD n=1 Tax=uncultured Neptuniibacter sp. TaxID=502143 RepID=UPI00262441E1|nr:high frequency lysogenization protein HflD [uncultured Neptuniibacter sp.]